MQEDANYIRKLKDQLKDWKQASLKVNAENQLLKAKIKETIRILSSAINHYDDNKTNWAIERAIRELKR